MHALLAIPARMNRSTQNIGKKLPAETDSKAGDIQFHSMSNKRFDLVQKREFISIIDSH